MADIDTQLERARNNQLNNYLDSLFEGVPEPEPVIHHNYERKPSKHKFELVDPLVKNVGVDNE